MEVWFILGVMGFFFYSISSAIDKYLMNHKYPPVVTDGIKMFFDGVVILIIGLLFFRYRVVLDGIPILLLLGLGAISALGGILYFAALNYDDVSELVPFSQASYIMLTVFSAVLLLGENLNGLQLLLVAIILLGVFLLLSKDKLSIPQLNKGILFMSLSTLLGVIFAVAVKQSLETASPMTLAIFMYFGSALFVFVYILVRWKNYEKPVKEIVKRDHWTKILISAIFGGAGTLLFFMALKLGDLSKVIPLSSLQSVCVFLFGVFLLKEKFYLTRMIGVGLVGLGIYLLGSFA